MSASSGNSGNPNDEYERTILVSGLPEGVDENKIKIHFQKKKNGGGDIEKITLLRREKAMVVFENPEVAKKVVKTEQIFNKKVLEVKRLENENLKEYVEKIRNEKGKTETRRVLVSGLPEGTTKNNVHIHFQKKKNGGGEIEKVELLEEGKAVVFFEESRVAKQVISQEQTIKGKTVEVKLMETEPRADVPTPEAKTTEQESGTVLVSGLPEGVTENDVHIHFQKKKNGGGEVKQVKLLSDKKQAKVVFEDMEVAKRVIMTKQILKGKELNVKLEESERDDNGKSRTIWVSKLPGGVTESDVHIHFQKKKNGGGEVEKVTIFLEKNTALVVFEDPEVAEKVVKTKQVFKGQVVDVKPQINEKLRTISVSNIPDGVTESDVFIHFQKRRNGGGEVEKVAAFLERNTALVVFEDLEVAKRVITTPQKMKEHSLNVAFLHEKGSPEMMTQEVEEVAEVKTPPKVTTPDVVGTPNTEKPPETEIKREERKQMEERTNVAGKSLSFIDPVFSMVTATVNHVLMNTGTQYFWSDIFNIMQKTCGVQCQASVYGVMISGSLSQVAKAGEILELHWRRQCQKFDPHNFSTQHGMTLNQAGTTGANGGINFNQRPVMSFSQQNPNFSQPNPNIDQIRSQFHQIGANFHQHGATYNQNDAYSNQPASNFKPNEANFNEPGMVLSERGTVPSQHAPRFNQRGTTNSIGSPFQQQQFVGSEHIFNARPNGQFNSQNVHQQYQQTGWIDKRQRPKETSSGLVHSYTGNHGNTPHNQQPFLEHPDMRPLNQPLDANQYGFSTTNANLQSFGNRQNIPPGYVARSPYTGETDPRGPEQPISSYDTIRNPQPFTSPSNRPTSGYMMENDQTGGSKTNHLSAKPSTSQDSILRPSRRDRDEVSTKSIAEIKNTTPKVNGTSSMGNTEVTATQKSSRNGTAILQPSVNNHNSISPQDSAKSNNSFGSPSNDKEAIHSKKPPPVSPTSTTNDQTPVKNQDSIFPDPSAKSGMYNNPSGSPADDNGDTRNEKLPAVSPRRTTNDQTPVNNEKKISQDSSAKSSTSTNPFSSPLNDNEHTQEGKPPIPTNTTNDETPVENQHSISPSPSMAGPKSSTASSNTFGSQSNDNEDTRKEIPPLVSPKNTTHHETPTKDQHSITPNLSMGPNNSNGKTDPTTETKESPKSATNNQLPLNDEKNTSLNATDTKTGQESIITNEKPNSHDDKLPGSSETTIDPSSKGDDQQESPTTGSKNSTVSNNKDETLENGQPDTNVEKQPTDGNTTTPQQPSIDQKGTTKNLTIESPNSSTSDDNLTETTSTNSSESPDEKPSKPLEKTLNNQPPHNQQQQTIDQTSLTPEIQDAENSPNDSTPSAKTKQIPSSQDKSQKKTPIPAPRQNKPGTRQNAAKFDVKPQQSRQETPSPTKEPNTTCVNDKPTTATGPNKPDQTPTTESPETSTVEHNGTRLDEELD